MVNLQSEFEEFHDNIKLNEYEENDTLHEKRDILLNKLKKNISSNASSYTTFNQGSYAMGTGIKPDDGDYDIDVGLRFNIDKDDYSDPVDVKKWVFDALEGHTKKVEIRRSCVTVTYQEGEEPVFHVDFAVYANNNSDGRMYIAKGKKNSSVDNKFWEETDPEGLMSLIKNRFTDTDDRKQFRRVIRYMKKWKSHNSYMTGHGAPTGIAITVLAYNLFQVKKTYDSYSRKYVYDDFNALLDFVLQIKAKFTQIYCEEDDSYYYVISQNLPVAPNNNLFSKMTCKEMQTFYEQLSNMEAKLTDVSQKSKKSEACDILIKLFGEDFPYKVERSIVSSSESA